MKWLFSNGMHFILNPFIFPFSGKKRSVLCLFLNGAKLYTFSISVEQTENL